MALMATFSPLLEAASMDPANIATFLISFDNFSSNALSFYPIPAHTLDPVYVVRKQMNDTEIVGLYLGPFLTNPSMSICIFSVTHKVSIMYSTPLQPSLNSDTT